MSPSAVQRDDPMSPDLPDALDASPRPVPSTPGLVALCGFTALLAGIAAAAGVFLRGSGATRLATSLRGELVQVTTDGVYAHNPERVVAEGVGWDYVTLLLAVPAVLVLLPAIARGSLRARLLALGIFAYFFYQYLMYAVFWALGPLFPVHVAIYPLAMAAMIALGVGVDLEGLPARLGARFPRRGVIALAAAISLLLLAMWSQRIALGLQGDLAGAGLAGMPTLAVQALDLGIVVPVALAAAVALRRRWPIGHLLAVILTIKGLTMGAAICAMLLSAWAVEGRLEVAPLAIFAAITATSAALAWRALADAR
ncbi:MAG: hypothetical protein R3B09_05190 [Nannocystaceae bacterium]